MNNTPYYKLFNKMLDGSYVAVISPFQNLADTVHSGLKRDDCISVITT